MWLKTVIVVLFIALVISLFSGLNFLIRDQGVGRRTWNALAVRLTFATLLMSFIAYGLFTGQLRSNAPWDARYSDQLSTPSTETIKPEVK
jgi:hypothetical protein